MTPVRAAISVENAGLASLAATAGRAGGTIIVVAIGKAVTIIVYAVGAGCLGARGSSAVHGAAAPILARITRAVSTGRRRAAIHLAVIAVLVAFTNEIAATVGVGGGDITANIPSLPAAEVSATDRVDPGAVSAAVASFLGAILFSPAIG